MSKEIDKADIEEYLATQSDFDLELFVYRSVQEHGMTASHGGSYYDPLTGKNRQFDVRAYMYVPEHRGIFLAIECKSLSKTFPLIVSRVRRPADDAYHSLIQTWGRRENGEDFQTVIRSDERMPLYRPGAPVGKKTVQLAREGSAQKIAAGKKSLTVSDGETFDKWSQALSSAADLIKETRKLRGAHGSGNFYSMIVPVLVVSNETLWVVDYSDTGNAEPQSVDETTLFVDRRYEIPQRSEPFTITHLHIFTRCRLH